MTIPVLHLGGNGHAEARLGPARAALARRHAEVRLVDVPYPGFEGRPRAASREAFLDAVAASCREARGLRAYASGVGALIALAARARGALDGVPLIVQAPVLWGLEHRVFPRVMRWRLPRWLLARAFRNPSFQRRFARTHFVEPPDPALLRAFFEGYHRCGAFADLFEWFTPDWLRDLGRQLRDRPGSLRDVTVWVGGEDRVVDRGEVEATERALGPLGWRVAEFPTWGHYPMIDAPGEWADALIDAVATPA